MTTKPDITGRMTGALYVVVIVTGMFSLVYVPGEIHLTGTASRPRRSLHQC